MNTSFPILASLHPTWKHPQLSEVLWSCLCLTPTPPSASNPPVSPPSLCILFSIRAWPLLISHSLERFVQLLVWVLPEAPQEFSQLHLHGPRKWDVLTQMPRLHIPAGPCFVPRGIRQFGSIIFSEALKVLYLIVTSCCFSTPSPIPRLSGVGVTLSPSPTSTNRLKQRGLKSLKY